MSTIYFGTNRRVISEKPTRFDNRFHEDKPYHYRVGKVPVKKVGHSWKNPNKAYRCGKPVLFEEQLVPEKIYGSLELFNVLHDAMLNDARDVIVFLHGFNNSFASAMERAAELAHQYLAPRFHPGTGRMMVRGRREPMIFAFSWPSDDALIFGDNGWPYSSDREDARASGLAIARCAIRMFQYLQDIKVQERCTQRVHLIAHSMGGWALVHAVQELVRLAQEGNQPLLRIFQNVFLMASDLENDALERENWLSPLLRLTHYVHVYHANNDSTLSASDIKPGHGARLGHDGPADILKLGPRVMAIDCSHVSYTPADGILRHQYYRMAPEVVSDIRDVLAEKAPHEMRQRETLGQNRVRLKLDKNARAKLSKKR